jgi:protocatechuate 3,4-dioxygenase beta subunit
VWYSFTWVTRLLSLILVVVASIVVAATAGTGSAEAQTCRATPTDAFGPFGRGMPPVRARTGRGHVLTGTVLSALGCGPLRGAQVQFWQANRRGRYMRALSATVLTNRAGRFRYTSPVPVPYNGGEPHIHIRVIAEGHEPLLSRYVPARGARRGSIRLVLIPEDL